MTSILGIDTATRYATVAVTTSDKPTGPVIGGTWFSKHNHGVVLLEKVNGFLDEAGVAISDLTHIAVVTGPGSFSALRVGLATAQGMALARDIQLLSIPTFEVEIEPWAGHDGPICAVVDAGSTGVAWGLYSQAVGGRKLELNALDSIEDCVAACPDATVFCGESARKFSDLVEPERILSDSAPTRSANSLIRVALQKLATGEAKDPSKVEITYARPPTTTTPTERLPDGSRPQKAR